MSVRILHVHSTFAGDGWSMRAVRLMNAFGDVAEHAIVCAQPGRTAARDHITRGVRVSFPANAPPIEGRPGLSRLFQLSRHARKYDLVLTYDWGAFAMVMARRLYGGPPLVHHQEECEASAQRTSLDLYRRLGLSSVYRLVVASRLLERIACTTWDQPPERVVYIADGINLAGSGTAAADHVAQPRTGELVVGTVGRLIPSSNLSRLVRAIAAMNARNIRLVIVGEGPESDRIITEARRCGIADRVVLPGALDPAAALARFDLFALSSDAAPCPMPLVEAMAAGLPVVATAVGDVAAIVATDNLPLIVEPDDEAALAAALDTLADRADLRRAIGRANREKARAEFDEKVMFALHARLYGEAIGAPDAFVAALA